ncbi:MAG TPA: hypothetical protein VK175_05565 [Leadbetterella sp.]|nr:hypothetical protein [Leadbetterella sp.]
MLDKINISKIVKNHFSTLINANSGKPDWDDLLTFYGLPIIATSTLTIIGIKLNSEATNIIITTLSIFVGLMFNIIVLLFDIVKRDASRAIKNLILKQLLENISFAIILSILAILMTLITYSNNFIIKSISTCITYYLLTLFLITLLMILKRMYNVFKNEIEELERASSSTKNE